MRRSTEFILSGAMLLCYNAFCAWLFCMSRIQNECQVMRMSPALTAAFLLCAWLLNTLPARRGVSLSLYVIIQLALSGAGIFLLLGTMELSPGGTGTRVLMSVVFAGGVFVSAVLVMEPPKLSSLVTCFDATVFLALILLFFGRFSELPALKTALWSCVAAIAASLAALTAGRVQRGGAPGCVRGSPAAGRALIAGALALMAALTALLTAFASGGLQSLSEAALAAVKRCWELAVAAAKLMLELLERFIMWLSQFMSGEPAAAGPLPAGAQMSGADYTMQEMTLPPWLGRAVIALGIAALAWLLIRMRRVRARGRALLRRRPEGGEVRVSGLAPALRGLFARLLGALRRRLDCIRFRKTPAGLLSWCERRAPKIARRAPSESGSEFLLRLRALASDPQQAAALEALAGLVELCFYSPRPAAAEPELYAAVHRCRFRAAEPVNIQALQGQKPDTGGRQE